MFALTETHSHSQRHLTEQLPSVKSPTNRTALYPSQGVFLTDQPFNSNSKSLIQSYRKKPKQPLLSRADRRKLLFNKLYGFSNEFLNMYERAKRKKYLPLEEYQQNILNAFTSVNEVDKDHFNALSDKFRDIREEANTIEPLPPINFSIIYKHSIKEEKQKREKGKSPMNLKEALKQKKEKDEFEKEMDSIAKHRSKIKPKYMNKNLKLLPQYIVEKLSKKLKLKV